MSLSTLASANANNASNFIVKCYLFWENLPKCTDNFYLQKLSVITYLSYGASFDTTLVVMI